jgi:hypothetical protein
MKKPWQNPVERPAKQSTLDTPGEYAAFKTLLRQVVKPALKRSSVPASSDKG